MYFPPSNKMTWYFQLDLSFDFCDAPLKTINNKYSFEIMKKKNKLRWNRSLVEKF